MLNVKSLKKMEDKKIKTWARRVVHKVRALVDNRFDTELTNALLWFLFSLNISCILGGKVFLRKFRML